MPRTHRNVKSPLPPFEKGGTHAQARPRAQERRSAKLCDPRITSHESRITVFYAAFRNSSPFCQLHGHSSSVCSASRTRSVSCGLRPTLRPFTVTCWMTLSGSTMKVAR